MPFSIRLRLFVAQFAILAALPWLCSVAFARGLRRGLKKGAPRGR